MASTFLTSTKSSTSLAQFISSSVAPVEVKTEVSNIIPKEELEPSVATNLILETQKHSTSKLENLKQKSFNLLGDKASFSLISEHKKTLKPSVLTLDSKSLKIKKFIFLILILLYNFKIF